MTNGGAEVNSENLSEAMLWSIRSLSRLFLVSIVGSMVTVALATGVGEDVDDLWRDNTPRVGDVAVGPYELPFSALPISCVVFAALMLWLTWAKLRTIGDLLDDESTKRLASLLLRISLPMLTDASKQGQPILLSGPAVLLYNWGLFFGCSIKLILLVAYSGSIESPLLVSVAYASAVILIATVGVTTIVREIRRIAPRVCHAGRLHRLKWLLVCVLAAGAFVGGAFLT